MKSEEKVYSAYLESKKNKLYFNQLKAYTHLSNSSLQNILNKFVREGILILEKTKSNTFYEIKNKKLFSLKFSEIAINKFEQLSLQVKSPLKNFIDEMPKHIFTIVLFGSASKNEQKKGSDIDILVVEDKGVNLNKIKNKINNLSNHPLSIFKCSIEQFYKRDDHVIMQAIKTGVPIYREQNFYEVILNEYK